MRPSQKSLFLVLALFLLTKFVVSAQTEDPIPLDSRQVEIANKVIDKFIERIKAFKDKYPELAKFGEAPYFTRGNGEFRYDYKIETVKDGDGPKGHALPGGCGIYFQLAPSGSSTSKAENFFRDAQGSIAGAARANINPHLSILVYRKSDNDNNDSGLIQAFYDAELAIADTTFAQLASEYLLAKKGIALDSDSLLAAAENPDPVINESALRVLRFHPLTATQIARIRQGLLEGKIPLARSYVVSQVIHDQDPDSLPAFFVDLINASFKIEQAGADTFQATPFVGNSWVSDAGTARSTVFEYVKSGDPAYLQSTALILVSDRDYMNRFHALDYIASLSSPEAKKLFLDALNNSFNSIQVHATEIVGEKKITAAEPGLRALLDSPSSKVRAAAVAALKKLGIDAVASSAPPQLSDAARAMADMLWKRGLNDDDFLKSHQLMAINQPLMKTFDHDSVEKEAAQYTSPSGKHKGFARWDSGVPPQFLLAAALKFHDEANAQLLYGHLRDTYETDEAMSDAALNTLGWDRFAEGLDLFHRKKDDDALPYFAQVIALSDIAKPFSPLSVYIRQSHELTDYLKNRAPDQTSPAPDQSDTEAYVKYWIFQLRDCDGSNPSPAGEKIRQVGLPAIPFLIDVITDKTPTRNFSYGRSYLPQRSFIYVGIAAQNIIHVIGHDYGLNPPGFSQDPRVTPSQLQEKFRVWFKNVPTDKKPVPLAKRDRELLFPAWTYFPGDD